MYLFKYLLFILIYSTFSHPSFASKDQPSQNCENVERLPGKIEPVLQEVPINSDDVYDKLYLVHASTIAPADNKITAGSLKAKVNLENLDAVPEFKIYPSDSTIRCRFTLHHCVGKLVSQSSHADRFNIFGMNVQSSSKLDQKKNLFVYMEPVSEFRGEIIGGYLNDLFTADTHTYGPKTIVLVPEKRLTEFKEKNPSFPGSIHLYNPDTQNLRELTQTLLKQNGAWTVDMKGAQAQINNQPISYSEIQKFFESQNFVLDDHSTSDFNGLESILEPINKIFLANHNEPELDVSHLMIPQAHFYSLYATAHFYMNEILEKTQHLNPEKRDALRKWILDIHSWLELVKKDGENRGKFGKSLFYQPKDISNFAKSRNNPKLLEELFEAVNTQPKTDREKDKDRLLHYEPRWNGLIPDFLKTVDQWDSKKAEALYEHMKHYGDPLQTGDAMMTRHFLVKLLKTDPNSENYAEIGQKMLKYAKQLAPSIQAMQMLSEIFSSALIRDQKGTLAHMNHISTKTLLSHFSQDSAWLKRDIHLEDVLRNIDDTKTLFNRPDPQLSSGLDFSPIVERYRQWFLRHHPATEKYVNAYENAQNFKIFRTYLDSYPLDQEDHPLYKALDSGDFGTLSDLFRDLGLYQEFRQKFPTDNDFWELKGYIGGSTFSLVALELNRVKQQTQKHQNEVQRRRQKAAEFQNLYQQALHGKDAKLQFMIGQKFHGGSKLDTNRVDESWAFPRDLDFSLQEEGLELEQNLEEALKFYKLAAMNGIGSDSRLAAMRLYNHYKKQNLPNEAKVWWERMSQIRAARPQSPQD